MQLSIRDGLRIVGLVGPRRNRTAALSTSEVASQLSSCDAGFESLPRLRSLDPATRMLSIHSK